MVKVLAVVLALAGAVWFTAPADAAARKTDGIKTDGIQNGQTITTDLSARRYYRRYGGRYRYYGGGPYYGYGYPYGYYPYGYYRRGPGIYFGFY
jgi:hypothetical protein